jgi:hypothetical protein
MSNHKNLKEHFVVKKNKFNTSFQSYPRHDILLRLRKV